MKYGLDLCLRQVRQWMKIHWRVVPFADGFAVKKRALGIWWFHRVMDPNAPIDAPAPLSVIRKFHTFREALEFIGNNNG
jgi:hypothetical protein